MGIGGDFGCGVDHLRGLIRPFAWFAAAFLLTVIAGPVFAAWEYTGKVQATTGGTGKVNTWTATGSANITGSASSTVSIDAAMLDVCGQNDAAAVTAFHNNVSAACAAPVLAHSVSYYDASNGYICNYTFTGCGLYGWGFVNATVANACPPGTSENSSDHLCYSLMCPTVAPSDANQNAWQSYSDTQCRRPAACESGQSANPSTGNCECPPSGTAIEGQSYSATGRYTGDTFCAAGCVVQAANGSARGTSGTVTRTEWYGPFSTTGATCTGTTGGGAEDTNPCGPGKVKVVVAGISSCVKATSSDASPGSDTSTETENKPGGGTKTTTTETTEEIVCEGKSCKKVTTETTTVEDCDADNVCTTTETTKTTDSPYLSSEDNPITGFCEDNPDASICQSGSWGGSCSAGFTCDGDAVQCATAEAAWKSYCAVWGEDYEGTGEHAFGSDLIAEGGSVDLIQADERELSSLNITERLSAGTCPAPSSFDTPLGDVVIDWTNVCSAATWFSFIIVGTAMLIAARIVLGSL